MRRVLVTGASGFVGRHVICALTARGSYEVHAVSSKGPLASNANCTWHTANLLDIMQAGELLRTVLPTHVLHLAWCTSPGEYWASSENLAWVQASLELLQRFQEYGGQRIVMAGTCAEYDWSYGYCSEFVTPIRPSTPYGACKHALQAMLNAYSEETGLSSAWGRIFLTYGPHENSERLAPSVIKPLLQGKPATCSHGNQIRDLLYAQDVADAFVELLESDVSGPVNIASGKPVTLREVICKIAAKLGREDLIQLGSIPTRPEEAPLLVADVRRLHDEVDWTPKFDLDMGLERTIEWWREELNQ